MRNLSFKVACLSCAFMVAGLASAQVTHRPQAPVSGTWQRAAHNPPAGLSLPLLLTDGTIMCHSPTSSDWYKLTPTATGSYQAGTWTKLASMQSDYGPLYYSSGVLADGRVVVIGGEYNLNQGGVWTNKGSWYDPVKNKWTPLAAPSAWTNIGDAQCQIMPDGRFVVAHIFDDQMASLDPKTMTWTMVTGQGKTDRFDEEGWVLMPDGSILTVCAENAPHAERYIPSLGKWISAGNTPASLCDAGSEELGPMLLMPDGKVFAFGATGHNAIYTPGANLTDTGTWAAAPDFPNVNGQLDIADGPAVLMPNGKLLAYASPGVFNSPSHFYEWDGTALLEVNNLPNSAGNPSFVGNFLVLPNGQIMFTDFSGDVEFYTPVGGPKDAWRPTISSVPSLIIVGKTSVVRGTQFNGLSNGAGYGDDSTNNSNYPLVRVRYKSTGHVVYFRTHDHSTMAVATGTKPVFTNFDVPANAELGTATLEVVANGIASLPVDVTISKDALKPTGVGMYEGVGSTGSVSDIYASENSYFSVDSINEGATGQVSSAWVTFQPGTGLTNLSVDFESNVSQSVQILVFAYNWGLGKYEAVGNAKQSNVDSTNSMTIANAGKYVSGTGQVNLLFRAINPNRSTRAAAFPIKLNLDKVSLTGG